MFENAIFLRQEITAFFSRRWKINEKNTSSTVQITAVREHMQQKVSDSRNMYIVLISCGSNRELSLEAASRHHHKVIIADGTLAPTETSDALAASPASALAPHDPLCTPRRVRPRAARCPAHTRHIGCLTSAASAHAQRQKPWTAD